MRVSKGKSGKATSRTKDVRSTDFPFNLSLLFNVFAVGICAHHRPQLARPLMSLVLSLLLIPQFRGVYIPIPNATDKPLYRIATSLVLHHLCRQPVLE